MIAEEEQYRVWLKRQRVGSRDKVASSIGSYVSYLRSVSIITGRDVSPKELSSEADVARIAAQLRGQRAIATIKNYKSAMRQYVAMVEAGARG